MMMLSLLLVSLAAQAQTNGKFASVDATLGYTVGGAAPNNQMLCGNGTRAVFQPACGTVSVPFYQTIQLNGGSLPQRFILNFDSNFSVSDTSPSTTVHLASTISVDTSGNAATATNAVNAANATNATNATNANAVGGVPLSGLCQTSGTGCPIPPGVSGTLNVVTGSRGFGTTFTNANATAIYVSGYGITPSGGATSQINCTVNGTVVYSAQHNATVTNGSDPFTCMVPAGGTYSVTTSGTAVNLQSWTEFVF